MENAGREAHKQCGNWKPKPRRITLALFETTQTHQPVPEVAIAFGVVFSRDCGQIKHTQLVSETHQKSKNIPTEPKAPKGVARGNFTPTRTYSRNHSAEQHNRLN